MAQKRVLSSIPEIPPSADPSLRRMLAAIKEALEVRLGQRGDPLEEAVTKRDLVESGLASLRRNGALGQPGEPGGAGDLGVMPPIPSAFTAVGVFNGVLLSWDLPQGLYEGHGHTEIWRSDKPTPESRAFVGTAVGGMHFDPIATPDEGEFYYWIRFVSANGRVGPFSGMVKALKPADLEELLKRLSGQIDESALSTALSERIALIDASDATPGSVAARIKTESIERVQGDQALAMSVSTLQTVVKGNTASISQQALTLNGLSAQYTLRLDVNGYVSGFGAYNDGKTSDFAVLADRFWIAPPNSTGRVKPFIVQNSKVYIDTAMIREASIQAAQIGSVSFGKIIDGAGNPVTVVGGGLKAQYIQTDELWTSFAQMDRAVVGTAHIRNASITTAKIQDLAVDTLKIKGNAVTVPVGMTGVGYIPQVAITLDEPGLVFVIAMANFIATDSQSASCFLRARCFDQYGGEVGVTAAGGGSTSAVAFGSFWMPAGTHVCGGNIRFEHGTRSVHVTSIFAMGVKR